MPRTLEQFSLYKFQLIWCTEYRRPVLEGKVRQRLMVLLREKAAEIEMTIHAMEAMPDHAHLFIETDPRWCVAEIAARLKGYTSHVLREEFPHLRSRLPALWSKSYFAATVGSVTETAVRNYIANQQGK